jgi:hypothetical protein
MAALWHGVAPPAQRAAAANLSDGERLVQPVGSGKHENLWNSQRQELV